MDNGPKYISTVHRFEKNKRVNMLSLKATR